MQCNRTDGGWRKKKHETRNIKKRSEEKKQRHAPPLLFNSDVAIADAVLYICPCEQWFVSIGRCGLARVFLYAQSHSHGGIKKSVRYKKKSLNKKQLQCDWMIRRTTSYFLSSLHVLENGVEHRSEFEEQNWTDFICYDFRDAEIRRINFICWCWLIYFIWWRKIEFFFGA